MSPFDIFRSIFLWLRGLLFCVTWREKSGFNKAPDALIFSKSTKNIIMKQIIFICHGESDWNEIFNKEKLLLLPRLFFGILRECTKCLNSQDSVLSCKQTQQTIVVRWVVIFLFILHSNLFMDTHFFFSYFFLITKHMFLNYLFFGLDHENIYYTYQILHIYQTLFHGYSFFIILVFQCWSFIMVLVIHYGLKNFLNYIYQKILHIF